MKHFIFSNSLILPKVSDQVEVSKLDMQFIDQLKNSNGSDIYLAGGGEFAGWLLEHQKIDILKIKLNPMVLGDGVRMFGSSRKNVLLKLTDIQRFDAGLQILTYRVNYL
jgi:dihydrofolate reductase